MKISKVKFLKTGKGKYSMSCDGVHRQVVVGDEALRKFLMAIRASDTETTPKSVRKQSYRHMAQGIASGSNPFVWAPYNKINGLPTEIKESALSIQEVTGLIKKLAKKTRKSEDYIEKMWEQAIGITEEMFGKNQKKFSDKEWAYVMGVLYNSLGIDESRDVAQKFVDSEQSAKEFVDEVQGSDSFGLNSTIVKKKKKPKVVDQNQEIEDEDKS